MKTLIWAALGAMSLMAPGIVNPAIAGEQLILATGHVKDPAYTAGVGLASLIKFELQPVHKIDVQAVRSQGPVDNVRLMQSGAADLAILPSVTGHAAQASKGAFAGHVPELRLRAITTLWREALHLVVRDDDVSTGTIQDLLQLKNRKVFLGYEATGSVEANQLLLSGLGLDIDKTFDLSSPPDGDMIKAVKQGSLDAFSVTVSPAGPRFHDLGQVQLTGLKLLDITTDQMAKANGSHWLWTPYTIPATTYPGQDEDVSTVAHSNLLVVKADVPDETVYLITKSIFENLPYLKRVDPLLEELALAQALPGMSLPLHPGALRYFKEAGLIPDIVSPKAPANGEQPVNDEETGYPSADVAGHSTLSADERLLFARALSMTSREFEGMLAASRRASIPHNSMKESADDQVVLAAESPVENVAPSN